MQECLFGKLLPSTWNLLWLCPFIQIGFPRINPLSWTSQLYLPRPIFIARLVFPGLPSTAQRSGAPTSRFHLDSLYATHSKFFFTLKAFCLEVDLSETALWFLTLKNPYTQNARCPLISNCIWLKTTKWMCEVVRNQKKHLLKVRLQNSPWF